VSDTSRSAASSTTVPGTHRHRPCADRTGPAAPERYQACRKIPARYQKMRVCRNPPKPAVHAESLARNPVLLATTPPRPGTFDLTRTCRMFP